MRRRTAANPYAEPIRKAAHGLSGGMADYDRLIERIGDARFVLLGEATHGTHEFYTARATITRRLVEEKGFAAVAVEADWPDAYRVNRYVRGLGPGNGRDLSAAEALGDFRRFPVWMWRNREVLDFIAALRAHNDELSPGRRVGFYGLDLYSLRHSMRAVVEYLDRMDPPAAERARQRYGCFDHFEDPQAYGYLAHLGLSERCEQQVVAQLTDLRRRAMDYLNRNGLVAEDELFAAEQNARLARNAERYYRAMFQAEESSWNLRDRHMAATLEALSKHLEQTRGRGQGKIIVWAHNSHLGDARAMSTAQRGELTVGQLVRQVHGREAVLVGFTTYDGTVSAASEWDGPVERKTIQPAHPESYEAGLHESGAGDFMLLFERGDPVSAALAGPRLERAIGVIYRPHTELSSHYFHARLPEQFDAVVHFDRTRAVQPLEPPTEWEREVAETYPTGL